jgi:hypothetical protein
MLVSLPLESLAQAAAVVSGAAGRFAALVVERDEASLTVEQTLWEGCSTFLRHRAVAGPFRAITLDVNADLGTSGYFAPAAERLAEAGIPIIPQGAYLKDHVLVRAADADRAVEILEKLVRECGT